MSKRQVQIKVDQYGTGSLVVDGQDISNLVRGFTLRCWRGETTELDVTLTTVDVDVEATADLWQDLPPAVRPPNGHTDPDTA